VIAHFVEARRREIGIRMALGASTSSVIGLILRHTARPLAVGLCAGLVLSVIASHVLISQRYGISRLDPVAYAGVLLVVLAAGVAASAIPARRATRIEPARVLQAD
jgi:putative ABC transport system permease protein